jgi:hypothetical protein
MGLEYVNRRGDRYYVLQGKTKTGNPKYYCSKKAGGLAVERLSDGFELHENPCNAVVTVRRVRPSPILPVERKMLAACVEQHAAGVLAIVEVEGHALVVYSSDVSQEQSFRTLSLLVGESRGRRLASEEWSKRYATYSPMFRFQLADEDERLYTAERWCFIGAVDGWYLLRGPTALDDLAREYLPHLGKESFFELM